LVLPVRARAQEVTPVLTLDAAMRMGLERNPEIIALRQQRGVAEAGLVIARTYPFNPVWDGKIRAVNGPESAGITNRVSQEYKFLIDVEVRGQGGIRRSAAASVMSRTEWEIVASETALAVRVARAFDTTIYRIEKLKLLDEAIQENTKAVKYIEEQVKALQLKPVDLVTIRTDQDDFLSQHKAGESALVTAAHDLYRAVGVVNEQLRVASGLHVPDGNFDAEELVKTALEQRADLRAREFAVDEAQARLELEIRNRFGNPNVGPDWEYDSARVNNIGVQITLPLPLINTRQGEIQQRQAELSRANLDVRQIEVQVRQDVYAAVRRLEKARAWVEFYRKQVIPNMDKALTEVEKLYQTPNSGVDLIRVTDIRRKRLKARDSELDALLEVRQALIDLAAAVGDPSLAVVGPKAS
jgi:cobalt-zinc-cadmium efflux system outer membrane protein